MNLSLIAKKKKKQKVHWWWRAGRPSGCLLASIIVSNEEAQNKLPLCQMKKRKTNQYAATRYKENNANNLCRYMLTADT
jgi:hypothetical protein